MPDQESLKLLLLEGLEKEWLTNRFPFEEVASIYFGGGTPFLFGPKALGTVLSWINYNENIEITLEANPENVTYDAMKAYADIGINRVSIGVQSLDDTSLNILDRRHSAKKAIEALEITAKAGIANISLDLMYDLPHQTLSSWQATLKQLKQLPISHVSLYNLTFEPQTLFFKQKKRLIPFVPEPEVSLEMLQTGVSALEDLGFHRYEISAFAKPGFQAIHNKGYWTGRPFLGYGPSAFSYWEGKRFRNIAHLHTYVEKLKKGLSPIDFEEKLPYPANVKELLAVRLRLLEGAPLGDFALPSSTLEDLKRLEKKGWLKLTDNRAQLTEQGLLFYDSVASELL